MKQLIRQLNLIKIIIYRYLKKHSLKSILSIFGVSLGIAVFIAIRIASFTAQKAMKNLILSISPNVDLQISKNRKGFNELYYPKIKKVKGIKNIFAIVSTKTRMTKTDNLKLKKPIPVIILGYDLLKTNIKINNMQSKGLNRSKIAKLFSSPNQLIVTERFIKTHKIKTSNINIITAKGEVKFNIFDVIKNKKNPLYKYSNLIAMDFFSAQYYFNKENSIDKIDIVLNNNSSAKQVKNNLTKILGKDFKIKDLKKDLPYSGKLYKSFNLNLTIASMIALLVGMYLIFNTINSSIIQQRKEIGILRALGATKIDILFLFSLEGIVIGAIGSIIGLGLGWLLAHLSVDAFTSKMTSYYTINNVKDISFHPSLMAIGIAIGITISFLSSLIPAMSALRISPIESIRFVSYEHSKILNIKTISIIGIVFLFLAYISSQLKPVYGIPLFGFLANFLIILGISLLSPLVIKVLAWLLKSILFKINKIEMAIANENLLRNTNRNSITVSTLMISIALIINIFTLIESYHYSIDRWFNQVNNADFSILSGSSYPEGDLYPMTENRINSIKHLNSIKNIDYYRFYTISYNNNPLVIHSFRMKVAKEHANYTFIKYSKNRNISFDLLKNHNGVFISNSFALSNSIDIGDFIKLKTNKKYHNFKVVGILANYIYDKDIISMDRNTFKRFWNDKQVDIFKIYLKKNINVNQFSKELYKTIDNPEGLLFSSQNDFKNEITNAIDNTFTVFHALELITIMIAMMGITNALLSSIIERKREIAILRTIGATKKQIKSMIITEGGLIGIIGTLMGLISGILISIITVFIINKQTVGWHLEYSLPGYILLCVIIGAIILSVISAYYPAISTFKIKIKEALKYE